MLLAQVGLSPAAISMAMSWEGAAVPEVLWGQGRLQNKQQLPLRACAAGEPQQRPQPQGWGEFLLIPVRDLLPSAAPAEAQGSGFPWRTQAGPG